jgi:hypothetical protein
MMRCGVESRRGNVPMCCDDTSFRMHKMCYLFIKNSGYAD